MADYRLAIVIDGSNKGAVAAIEETTGKVQELRVQLAGANDANREAGDQAEKSSSKWTKAGAAIGGAIVAVATGISAITTAGINFADSLDDMSQRLGVTTEFLSSMGYAADMSDASLQALGGGLESLSTRLSKTAGGNRQFTQLFAAMGVEVETTAGKLRPLDDVLLDIADRFAGYEDGPAKAALANKLFGGSGEALIPMLNQGRDGIQAMREEAERYGLVIGGETSRNASAFNDNLARMRDMVVGVGRAIAADVLPTLVALSDMWVASGERAVAHANDTHVVGDSLREVAALTIIVKNAFEVMWESAAMGAEVAYARLGGYYQAAVQTVSGVIEANVAVTSGSILEGIEALAAGAVRANDEIAKSSAASSDAIEDRRASINAQFNDMVTSTDALTGAFARSGEGVDSASAKLGNYAPVIGVAKKSSDEFASAQDQARRAIVGFISQVDPARSALLTYRAALAEVNKNEQQGLLLAEEAAEARAALAESLRRTNIEIERQLHPEQEMLRSMDEEIALLGMSNEQRQIEAAVMDVVNEHIRTFNDLSPEQIEHLRTEITARQQTIDTLRRQQDQAQTYIDVVSDGFLGLADVVEGFANGQIKSLGDAWGAVVDDAKRTVAKIIAEFVKLRVLQPMLQGLFSQGGTFANLGSMMGFGNVSGQAQGQFGYAGGGGGTASLMNSVGPLLQGYAYPSSGGGMGSSSTSMLGGESMMPWMAAAGGAMYGYNNRGNSTGGSLAAGAAYGYTGYALGSVALGAYAGGAGAAAMGMGAGAVAGGAAGGASMAAAAIPVIGWIIAALVLIDLISGGKLFGTKFKPTGFEQGVAIDQSGGDAFLRVRERRERALFGGTQRRVRELDAGQEAEDQADTLFRAIEAQADVVGDIFGIAGQVVAGSFTRVLDKKGKEVKEEFSTVFGVKYNEKAEDFQTRMIAEAKIATIDAWLNSIDRAAEADDRTGTLTGIATAIGAVADEESARIQNEAHKIAERWRGNAQTLSDGANFLVAAATDMFNGAALLGETSTLTQITDLVEDLQSGTETLVQTYQRVRSATQMLDYAVELTGVTLEDTREQFVRFAVDIVDAAGGLERAQQLWNNFYEQFYGAGELTSRALTDLLSRRDQQAADIGVSPDITFEQFREIFEERLPTASAESVAAMLEFAETMTQVRDAIDALTLAEIRYQDFLFSLQDQVDQIEGRSTGFAAALRGIANQARDAEANANALARAAGRQGASERELALIHRWAALQIEQAIAQLEDATEQLAEQLGYDPLSAINAQIAALESRYGSFTDSQLGGIDRVGQASAQVYQQQLDALQALRDSLDETLVGDLSPLAYEDQLAEARRQLEEVAAQAATGDVDAINRFREMRLEFLRFVRDGEASGDDYQQQYNFAQALAEQILAFSPTGSIDGGPGTVQLMPSPELIELYRQRDELLAQDETDRRLALATDLGNHLRDLAHATGETVFQVMDRLGIDVSRLIVDLGGRIGEQTVESTAALATIANVLNVELPELAEQLGIDIGRINDANSLINDALEGVIAQLPEQFRSQLEPLLRDVENAGSMEESEAALRRLNDATSGLPDELRLLLAPYLEDVDPYTEAQLGQLDFLTSIDQRTERVADLLQEILATLRGDGSGVPGGPGGLNPGGLGNPGTGTGASPTQPGNGQGTITVPGTGPLPGNPGGVAPPPGPVVPGPPVQPNSVGTVAVKAMTDEVAQLREDLRALGDKLADAMHEAASSNATVVAGAIDGQTNTIANSRSLAAA